MIIAQAHYGVPETMNPLFAAVETIGGMDGHAWFVAAFCTFIVSMVLKYAR